MCNAYYFQSYYFFLASYNTILYTHHKNVADWCQYKSKSEQVDGGQVRIFDREAAFRIIISEMSQDNYNIDVLLGNQEKTKHACF